MCLRLDEWYKSFISYFHSLSRLFLLHQHSLAQIFAAVCQTIFITRTTKGQSPENSDIFEDIIFPAVTVHSRRHIYNNNKNNNNKRKTMENASTGRRAGLEKLLLQRNRACKSSRDTHTNTPHKLCKCVCSLTN